MHCHLRRAILKVVAELFLAGVLAGCFANLYDDDRCTFTHESLIRFQKDLKGSVLLPSLFPIQICHTEYMHFVSTHGLIVVDKTLPSNVGPVTIVM